jgi:hypothetical protein
LFCTMEFKRYRSPTIFAPFLYRRYGPDVWMTASGDLPVSGRKRTLSHRVDS